jgi:hypothetical protein
LTPVDDNPFACLNEQDVTLRPWLMFAQVVPNATQPKYTLAEQGVIASGGQGNNILFNYQGCLRLNQTGCFDEDSPFYQVRLCKQGRGGHGRRGCSGDAPGVLVMKMVPMRLCACIIIIFDQVSPICQVSL